MKHDLEVYRELLLVVNGVLKWEQQWYPGVIGGVLTFLFLLVWLLDFSTLTLVAVVALLVTVVDYGYPMVSKFVFKPENWSGAQEKLYEEVIENIVGVKLCIQKSISSFFSNRSERSTFVSRTENNEEEMKCHRLLICSICVVEIVSHRCHDWILGPRLDRLHIQQSFLALLSGARVCYVSWIEGKRNCQIGLR